MTSKTAAASRIAKAVAASASASASASSVAGKPGLEILYSTHPSWPYPPSSSASSAAQSPSSLPSPSPQLGNLDIAVLDSSFNPPSKAHLALTLSRPLLAQSSSAGSKRHYDAHLLLFSTNNADKGKGKRGDASLEQRVHMMTLLAQQIEHELELEQQRQQQQDARPNVAVALVDKPLIFDKSTLTWDALRQRMGEADRRALRPRLHWVVGFDTLFRVFQPKYYPSEAEMERQCGVFFDEERTTFVCARRDAASFPSLSSADEAADDEAKLLGSPRVKKWVDAGSVALLDLEPAETRLSSTRIREVLRDAKMDESGKRRELEDMVPSLLVEYLLTSGVYVDPEA